jgi:4-hydroxy-2-oxoheptanedioate aldolase
MIKSKALERLRAGDFVRTAIVTRVTQPWLAEFIGKAGYDLIWLDMEHRDFDYSVVAPMALACRSTGIDLMVRILKTGYSSPMRVLEAGANGIMVPHCRSAAEARQWVEWTRFFPVGARGYDGAGPDADFALVEPKAYMKHANDQTFLVLQIEDRDAVESVEQIAAVEGVDALFVGPADLTISFGVPFQFAHADVQKAIDRVANAAAKAGKWWGMPTGTPEATQQALSRGAKIVTGANDHMVLVRGYEAGLKNFPQ